MYPNPSTPASRPATLSITVIPTTKKSKASSRPQAPTSSPEQRTEESNSQQAAGGSRKKQVARKATRNPARRIRRSERQEQQNNHKINKFNQQTPPSPPPPTKKQTKNASPTPLIHFPRRFPQPRSQPPRLNSHFISFLGRHQTRPRLRINFSTLICSHRLTHLQTPCSPSQPVLILVKGDQTQKKKKRQKR